MKINWEEIKEKYPKSFKMFCKNCIDINVPDIYVKFSNKAKDYINYANEQICYCDLEKFFDDNGIIICVGYLRSNKLNKDVWHYQISYKSRNKIKTYYVNNDTRIKYTNKDEAKQQAILKAFEILEEQLNK